MAEKYYWLRLKRDFFKRHDIRIIESMTNGKDYILFYLKLLCESVDHEGKLRFSEQIPYNEEMLATITNTNVDIVRSAIKVFTELNMMEILDDGTIFMNEVEKLIGTAAQDDHTRESTRLRVQAFRERQKQALIGDERYSNVTCNGEIEKDKELDTYKEKEKEREKEKESALVLDENNVYTQDSVYQVSTNGIPTVSKMDTEWIQDVSKVDTQVRLDQVSLGKDNNIESERAREEVRKAYGIYNNVRLTDAEMQSLRDNYPDEYEQMIENLSEYMKCKGKFYSDHYATLMKWKREDEKKAPKKKDELQEFYDMVDEMVRQRQEAADET